jgi:hypothetical protein
MALLVLYLLTENLSQFIFKNYIKILDMYASVKPLERKSFKGTVTLIWRVINGEIMGIMARFLTTM